MRASTATAALALLACVAGVARAEESLDKPAREALATAARELILIAVEDPKKACDLCGPDLPADLRRDLEAVKNAPRAKDVQKASPKLKQALLKQLIDESADAQDVNRRFADFAGKVAAELDDLSTRAAKARTDGAALYKDASDGKYLSPAAVAAGKAGPMGPLLLRIAKAAPFLRGEVTAEGPFDARYRALLRAYEKAPEAATATLLAILASFDAKMKGTGVDRPEVAKLVQLVRARLDGARDATVDAMKSANDAATSLRQGELSRAVQGTRNADLEYGVKLLTAFKKQFSATPALDATEIAGIYVDRNTSQVYFYLEGEERWIAGAKHAASLSPVIEFLLRAEDRRLTKRTTDPRALGALYHAFGETVPFEVGLEQARKTAKAVGARARALAAVAAKGGATPEQVDRFFAEQAGYDRELAGPLPGLDDDACARRAMERLVRAVMDGGASAGAAIKDELDAALAALGAVKLLAFSGVKLEAPAGPGEATVALRAEMLATPPLVAPPKSLVRSGVARCVLVVLPGEDPKGAALEAECAGPGGEPFTARLELDVAGAAATGHVEGGSLAFKAGAVLQVSGRRGAKVRTGEKVLARLRPWRPARLKLQREKDEEVGPWTAEGGVIEPTAAWPAGRWTAVAVDDQNRPLAPPVPFEVEKGLGVVCVDLAESRVIVAKPGSKVELRFLESGALLPAGKVTVALEHAAGGLAWAPKEPVSCPKATLELPADLAPGRYRVVAQVNKVWLPSWPLAVVKEEPRVTLVRDPFCVEPPTSVGAGERLYARIEPGFAIEPSEVASAIVQLEAVGRGAAARARTTPVAGFPVTGLVVPITLKEKVPPGSWDLLADVYVGPGRLRAKGKVVIDPSAEMPFTLRPESGPERTLYARGDRAVVELSAAAGITTATFVLVGPDGLGSPVEVDERGQVTVAIPADAPVGAWELRGATRQDGTILQKVVPFSVYAPARFSVTVKGHVGEQGLVDVPIPAGYKEPVRVKVGMVWTDGNKSIVIPIGGAPTIPMVLEDKDGRRADGEAIVQIVAAAPVAPNPAGKGPRFAIVANVKERTFFFHSYDAVSRMLREAAVPEDWVVVEPGPLSTASARDWVFTKAPYDGPPAANPLSVYRSQRYWKNLPANVQARFAARGAGDGTVFDVTNSPVTEDEKTTIAMLAKRVVDEKGGWTWELDRVRVRSTGVLPAPPPPKGDDLSFQTVNFSAAPGGLTRIVVPGPLADLGVRVELPARLVLGKPFALAASVAAVPSPLFAGRTYPGGLEKLAAKTLLGASLEGTLDVEGKSIAVASSATWASLERLAEVGAGRELVFDAAPSGTEKLEDGSARVAESVAFDAGPPGKPAEGLDLRFEPIPPGTLANTAKRLVVKFKARLGVALESSAVSQEQTPPPESILRLDGKEYVIDAVNPGQLPAPEVEIEAVYVRQAAEGAPARGNPPAALAPGRLSSDQPEELAALDAAAELAAAAADLAAGKLESAEAQARRALHADASAAAWLAVGDALLRRGKAAEAVAPLLRAAALDVESGRPAVLLAEALDAIGAKADARAAAKKALARKLDADLSARARKISGE